ncbi:MAG TPA: glutamyl-tRNA reductase [Gemmatimonadaceae bacterium]|nr:glutamyl-tRNA reductase [Gemmatimonadaceae bacterium]
MAVIVLGVSHHGAPLDVREKLAFRSVEVLPALERLRARAGANEGVLLSTCNRTELYVVEGAADAVADGWAMLSERLGADASRYGYVRRDRDAAAHLFRVASGMDSLVVGEAQIHGQVRDAWEVSRAAAGTVLNRLFQSALLTAGRVRSETTLGHGALSVSSAAVQLSKKIFGGLVGRRAMVLGAGEMAELALASLQQEGVRAAIVANRTFERATELAAQYGATAVHYDAAWEALADVDLLLCSTSSPHPVVSAERVRAAVEKRGDRPLCILDIAMPRDVDPAVATLDNVFLYDMDDLHAVVSANLARRQSVLPAAEAVVTDEVEKFWQWVAGLAAVPVLTQFREEMNRVRERELSTALRRMSDLTPEQRAAVEHFSQALMNKFLHEPSVRLRAAAANGRGLGVVDAARYLFALDERAAAPVDPDAAPPAAPTGDER